MGAVSSNNELPTCQSSIILMDEWPQVDSSGRYGYSPGGLIDEFSAGASLNIGDVVYISLANTVNKNATAGTTLGKLAGVVVGGAKTDMRVNMRKEDVGILAAAVGERVLVQYLGKTWVVSDAAFNAGDVLAAGTTTAGRAKQGTITTDLAAGSSGNIIGNALETVGGAAVVSLIKVNIR